MEPGEMTIGEYLIQQLYGHGLRHAFGFPGDYVLAFYKLLNDTQIKIINTTDEQGPGMPPMPMHACAGWGQSASPTAWAG
jgi:hypothetical protein